MGTGLSVEIGMGLVMNLGLRLILKTDCPMGKTGVGRIEAEI